MLDMLAAQVASPVQFVKGLRTLFDAGARVFVEVGPKKALHGFVEDVLGSEPGVLALFTNHPKTGDLASFNQALCGLYAAGLGTPRKEELSMPTTPSTEDLGSLFAEFLERARGLAPAGEPPASQEPTVVVTGAGLGLPGKERVFDERNVQRILDGEQMIDVIPTRLRQAMLDKHVVRLVKRENGDPSFEPIVDAGEVIKLAARAGAFDLEAEFGVEADRVLALDRATQLAVAAGIDALRDAGIPLVQRYRTTTLGTQLPDRWGLPDRLRDDTGVIFASAFPAYNAFADELGRYYTDKGRRSELASLESARARLVEGNGAATPAVDELDRRIHELRAEIERQPYLFDRRFLFRCLSMGHAQFGEIIGARGPNTQINSACASTTQAIALAEDWIRAGRCRRVVVVAADDASSDSMMEWIGAGFLASGAAATDEIVEDAATPFDRRRHGLIVGMGAAAFVIEREDDARARGLRPICRVLATVTANSAFHGSRLDVTHITQVMESVIAQAERRWGIDRTAIAPELVFISHETYTPARGGSAAAEVESLRAVFGAAVDKIVVANTKGFTGHPMGVGIEDVVAVKALETGIVPPVPNFKEVDPDLGMLNLSKGGIYPIRYALRLAAGFGSQISMSLLGWVPTPDGRRPPADGLGYETRIVDRPAWDTWLEGIAERPDPELEVVQHRLRLVEPAHVAEPRQPATAPAAVASDLPPVVTPPAPEPVAPVEVELPPEPVVEAPPVVTEPVIEPVIEAAPPVPATDDDVEDRVLSLVAEVTGYPRDMLDVDLDLEADLGIDTVKQAEIFASLRETYGIARDENMKLRDFPTLAHVIGFMRDHAPKPEGNGQVAAPVLPPEPVVEAPPVVTEPVIEPVIEAAPPFPPPTTTWRTGCCRWWPRSPGTPGTCSTSTWTWRPTWGSTPSSRPRSSPRCGRPTGSPGTRT